MTERFEEILACVEKPSRYLGGEVNAVRKNRALCRLSFALAFPDAYEVGMSHLGLQILYAILNRDPDVVAERFYAPWPDMERLMRQEGLPLSSLETRTPLRGFDIVGFSLQYELSYTNVLNMLDLGGVPLLARDRREGDPLVIAGGPCAFNPAPVAAFFDALAVGEGEEVVSEIARAVRAGKDRGLSRGKILESLAAVGGVYVPAVHRGGDRIKKRTLRDLDAWRVPMKPLVPLMNTIHDRVTLEIARGCTRGCRFCQAGMVWRPVRERSPDVLREMADGMLCSTGYDELSLLSLSSGDHSMIEPVLSGLMNRYCDRRIAIGLPSLRVETLGQRLIEEIRRVRKTSFTLAPEAGTQRLRDVINKGNSEEDLLAAARRVFEAGWKSVKLYFMIGLPGERQEDLEGIVDLAFKVLRAGKTRNQVNIAISTLVPKPHTPFQWCRQISLEETLEKQQFFKKRATHRNLSLKWHDGRMSFLEGVFSRGDEPLAAVVERAFRLGCRFDGWSDAFRFDLWERALGETGVDPQAYLRERRQEETFPWDRIDTGVSREFLLAEKDKSLAGALTPDCRFDSCQACGVCDFKTIDIVHARSPEQGAPQAGAKSTGAGTDKPAEARWRLKFVKTGTSRFLSHLEVASALIRACRQADLSFIYSEGFHPHPRVAFAHATSVGVESLCEYADIRVEKGVDDDIEAVRRRINERLPGGLSVEGIEAIESREDELSRVVGGFGYDIDLAGAADDDLPAFERNIRDFLDRDAFIVRREDKGKSREKDIRPFVRGLNLDHGRKRLRMDLLVRDGGTTRAVEILTRVLGMGEAEARKARIVKKETYFLR